MKGHCGRYYLYPGIGYEEKEIAEKRMMEVPSLVLHDDLHVLKEGLEIFLMLNFL
jgi:hypothetical protein